MSNVTRPYRRRPRVSYSEMTDAELLAALGRLSGTDEDATGAVEERLRRGYGMPTGRWTISTAINTASSNDQERDGAGR